MNLKEEINEELWNSLESNYLKDNYTGAIQDSVYHLADLIRLKSNLKSDGVTLISRAFGSKTPKIKLNKLQTDSEKNIQKGTQSLLNGIFQAIRNPRSHGKIIDTKIEANKIIIFIDYLINQVQYSKSLFSIENIKKRIFDEDFVESEKYSELILQEIPKSKILEVLIEIFRSADNLQSINKRVNFFRLAYNMLSEDEKVDFQNIISELLKTTESNTFIKVSLIMMNDNWEKLEEISRLRIENKLIKSIKAGGITIDRFKYIYDSNATLAKEIYHILNSNLLLKDQLIEVLTNKFNNPFDRDIIFAIKHCSWMLYRLDKKIPTSIAKALKSYLEDGDDTVNNHIKDMPEEWSKLFSKQIESFVSNIMKANDLPF